MFDLSLLDNATLWVSTSFVIFVVITYNPLKKITNDALENKITELKKSLEESSSAEEDEEYAEHAKAVRPQVYDKSAHVVSTL